MPMLIRNILFLLLLANSLQATFCYFVPPEKWQCVKPKNLSPYVQVGFIVEGKKGFHPSINLAVEEVDVPLKDYIKIVKEIHLSEAGTKWRDLGKFSMKGGAGRLTEISTSSPWGPVKMLQAFLVQEDKAYILTAAVLKEEFPKYQKEILESLKTLQTAENLFSSVQNETHREMLKTFFASLDTSSAEERESLQKQLEKVVADVGKSLGDHWQFLALKEGYTKLYAPKN